MADTPNGETGAEPKTEVSTPTVPATDNSVDRAEVERLRKEADQAQMRANQLQNQLDKKTKEEEEAQRKRLEENDEWKTLAEQEKAKREALETEREAEARSRELKESTESIFKDFPTEVVELAQEAGLGLTDTSDEAKEAFTAKLEKLKARVVSDTKVTPNNPQTTTVSASREEQLQRMKNGDRQAREEIISNIPAVKAMRKMAGFPE